MVRPEKCSLTRVESPADEANLAPWHGIVASRTFAGAHTEYEIQMRNQTMTVWAFGAPDPALRESSHVRVNVPDSAIRVVSDD